jgi:hypothetical protein
MQQTRFQASLEPRSTSATTFLGRALIGLTLLSTLAGAGLAARSPDASAGEDPTAAIAAANIADIGIGSLPESLGHGRLVH